MRVLILLLLPLHQRKRYNRQSSSFRRYIRAFTMKGHHYILAIEWRCFCWEHGELIPVINNCFVNKFDVTEIVLYSYLWTSHSRSIIVSSARISLVCLSILITVSTYYLCCLVSSLFSHYIRILAIMIHLVLSIYYLFSALAIRHRQAKTIRSASLT